MEGTVPTYDGAAPTRPADGAIDYWFAGWSPAVTSVTGDVTYTAVCYVPGTVTWKNWDGTILEEDVNVAAGATPQYNGATPTRETDAENTYTFTGWSPAISPVNGDLTYTAVFRPQSLRKYKINVVDIKYNDKTKMPSATSFPGIRIRSVPSARPKSRNT